MEPFLKARNGNNFSYVFHSNDFWGESEIKLARLRSSYNIMIQLVTQGQTSMRLFLLAANKLISYILYNYLRNKLILWCHK